MEVNDPVLVTRDGRDDLEGVIAFAGPVAFANGDDWVGIRLTGTSVGLGKNDGSVQGRQYFSCPPSCGIFVKESAVRKRELTRLEELRLRRELAGGSGAPAGNGGGSSGTLSSMGSSATGGSGPSVPETPSSVSSASRGASGLRTPKPPGTARTPRTSGLKTPTASNPASSEASTGGGSRLEEIRQRRAALQVKTSSTPAPKSGPQRSPSVRMSPGKVGGGSSGKGSGLQSQVEELTEQLQARNSAASSLEKELAQARSETEEQKARVSELEQKLLEYEQNQDNPAHGASSSHSRGFSSIGEETEIKIQNLQAKVSELEEELNQTTKELNQQTGDFKKQQIELTLAKTEASQLKKEMANLSEQAENHGASDTSHYKERARLQAEVASLNRKVGQLELEKQDLENSVEELALDKEQIQEEKEGLEDRLEELKLDAETAQMEVEELRMELEDAKAESGSVEGGIVSADISKSGSGDLSDMEDVAQSLNVQNSRLREALIRLREQSSVEKMEISRQLRTAEKAAEEGKAVLAEVESLRAVKSDLEEQIRELKDMVEQSSAFEDMVEDLADRVLSLEEELRASLSTIREMEEAADITAEMEEVQSDELKALARDLEDRESIIRNLEEAIKMQRKREDDFQRTVGNYRNVVETLKQEKKALLELQQGGEGEKSDLVSASQKALARAAQLVQDAAEMRKREAQAAIDRIDSQIRMHLCNRLESMLPPTAASSEIASIKGELLLSKVVGKASLSLDGIARSFSKTARVRSWEWRGDRGENEDEVAPIEKISFSDEQQQMAATMVHQTEVAHVAIDLSGDLLWLLSAGQWPDVLGWEASAELGAIMGHSMADLDAVLGTLLNTLKEEGVLSPHQSNIGEFRQTIVSTMQSLKSQIEQDGYSLVPMDWKPAALRLFRDSSRAKFSSLGCYAAVASVLNTSEIAKTGDATSNNNSLTSTLRPLLKKLDQSAAEATNVCHRLAHLDVQDEAIVGEISPISVAWRAAADDLLEQIHKTLLTKEGLDEEAMRVCDAKVDEVIKLVSQFASVLRSADLNAVDEDKYHPFSPEVPDVWEAVTELARSVRSTDGDQDDVNYLLRARIVEHYLEDAIEKEPKLSQANTKIASLEKSLASRSKEIAMQNARLVELEKLLAKTSAQPSPRIKSVDMTSSAEIISLKEENRVLSEAMDVVHRQVEEYESEIRFLKDSKTPGKAQRSMRTPRRVYTDITDRRGNSEDLQPLSGSANLGAFEAALFRPALSAARSEAARWKAKAVVDTLLELPPLSVPGARSVSSGEEKTEEGDAGNPYSELTSALMNYRMELASVKIVNICDKTKNPRASLNEMLMKKAAASERLDKATASARLWLQKHDASGTFHAMSKTDQLVGRVQFGNSELSRKVAVPTGLEDLYRIQLHMAR